MSADCIHTGTTLYAPERHSCNQLYKACSNLLSKPHMEILYSTIINEFLEFIEGAIDFDVAAKTDKSIACMGVMYKWQILDINLTVAVDTTERILNLKIIIVSHYRDTELDGELYTLLF